MLRVRFGVDINFYFMTSAPTSPTSPPAATITGRGRDVALQRLYGASSAGAADDGDDDDDDDDDDND